MVRGNKTKHCHIFVQQMCDEITCAAGYSYSERTTRKMKAAKLRRYEVADFSSLIRENQISNTSEANNVFIQQQSALQ